MSNWNERPGAWRWVALAVSLSPALAAQSLTLPASDPVSIGRSGAGVAFGRSLEAAGLNPALLPTLLERNSAYLGLGEEFQSSQLTLQSHQKTVYSTDRNRFVPSFGSAWKWSDRTVFGVRVDVPFLRHAQFDETTSSRFLGDEFSLKSLRAELQLARSFGSDGRFSLGLSAGAMKVDLSQGTVVRAAVGNSPSSPVSPTNPSLGLVETRVSQTGAVTVGTFGAGFRWALSPRWTVGGSAQTFLKGTSTMTAVRGDRPASTFANDGFGSAPLGLDAKAASVLALSSPEVGTGDVMLPGRATLGVRHRLNNMFTWEADLRFVRMSDLKLPTAPSLRTPGGIVGAAAPTGELKDSLGLLVAGEMVLGKRWTLRGGFALEQAFREDEAIEPLLGGAPASSFSFGAGLKAWGGEWNFGYQVRLTQDRETSKLDGSWSSAGYRASGTLTRVESMGHLFSIGFKKAF